MDKSNMSFGLTGYPLGHSMSPIIHTELFKLCGMSENTSYNLFEAEPEKLGEYFGNTLCNLKGFNVTIPHKIEIIKFLDELSYRAELFGAVNTVQIKDGKKIGHNTDCTGFLNAIKMADIDLTGEVLLCGSGGVARMIAFETILAGANLTIAVRPDDVDAANMIKNEIAQKLDKDCKIILLSEAKGGYDVVINGTPVGMFPHVDACPVEKEVITSSKAAFDVIYNPQETVFIKYAKEAGIKYSGGLSMLVWQAAVAQQIWNDVEFSYDDIDKVIAITQKELEKNE